MVFISNRHFWLDCQDIALNLAQHSLPPTLALPLSRAPIMPAISRAGSRSCKTTPAPLCRPQPMPNAVAFLHQLANPEAIKEAA